MDYASELKRAYTIRHFTQEFPQAVNTGPHQYRMGDAFGNSGNSTAVNFDDGVLVYFDHANGKGGSVIDLYCDAHDSTVFEAMKSIGEIVGISPPDDRKHFYDYVDRDGKAHTKVVVTEKFGSPKEVRQLKPDGAGEIPGRGEPPYPLYRLDKLLADPDMPVLVVEGEKAASVEVDGYVVTTTLGGASCPDKSDLTPLYGRSITVWPDNDRAGIEYAGRLKKLLEGKARVDVLRTDPGTKSGFDIADCDDPASWITQHRRARLFWPARTVFADQDPIADHLGDGLLIVGSTMVIAGGPKVGKSDFVLSMLLCLIRGEPFLTFAKPKNPLRVALYQSEIMTPVMRQRIRLALDAVDFDQDDWLDNLIVTGRTRQSLTPGNLERMVEDVKFAFHDTDILVVDPLYAAFDHGRDGKATENDNTAMAEFLGRLDEARRQINPSCCLIVVHHTRKGVKSDLEAGSPFEAVSGASSIVRYADTTLLLAMKPTQKDEPVDQSSPVRALYFDVRNSLRRMPPMMVARRNHGLWVAIADDLGNQDRPARTLGRPRKQHKESWYQ